MISQTVILLKMATLQLSKFRSRYMQKQKMKLQLKFTSSKNFNGNKKRRWGNILLHGGLLQDHQLWKYTYYIQKLEKYSCSYLMREKNLMVARIKFQILSCHELLAVPWLALQHTTYENISAVTIFSHLLITYILFCLLGDIRLMPMKHH